MSGHAAEAEEREPVAGHAGWTGRVGDLAASGGRALINLIVPPRCPSCRERLGEHGVLCPACWRDVDFIRAPLCDRLGLPLPFDPGGRAVSAAAEANPPIYDRARAVARYDRTMKRLIHDFKFHDRLDHGALLTRWLAVAGAELIECAEVIVPVPLYRLRLIGRRFNQSAELARGLSRLTSIPFDPVLLKRVRRTRPQVGLGFAQRRLNVRGAFAVSPGRAHEVSGRSVLLVDDVITTGATVEACARVLKAAGAARVDVLALALVTDPTHISM